MIILIILQYKQKSYYKIKYIDIIIREISSTKDKYEILHSLLCILKPSPLQVLFNNNSNLRIQVWKIVILVIHL